VRLGSFYVFVLLLTALLTAPRRARADGEAAQDSEILGDDSSGLRVQSTTTRISGFSQYGHGYQSQAGPVLGPGNERLVVFEPQTDVVFTQGDKLTHRIWLPFDVISAASPNSIAPPDVLIGASRHVESGTIDWTTNYKSTPVTDFTMRSGIHLENPFRSWSSGLGMTRAFADQNTVFGAHLTGIFDWFDQFDIHGHRYGRTERSTGTGTLSLTQVLSPTTIATMNYGLTVQAGELGNTWNSVPLADGTRGAELLPNQRVRHAVVGRLAQYLPWNGAVRVYYRFYADDWGIVAHSAEVLLNQRITPNLYVGALYRFHTQTGPFFYTTLAPVDATLRVADSDLAPLQSHTIGGKIVGDLRALGIARSLHYELEYDHYFRTNDLRMDVASCALGLRF